MHFSYSMEHSPAPVSISLEICAPPAAGIVCVRVCESACPPPLRAYTRVCACVCQAMHVIFWPRHRHRRTTPFLRHLSLSCALQRICDPNNHFIVCSSSRTSHKNLPKFCTFCSPLPLAPFPVPSLHHLRGVGFFDGRNINMIRRCQ